MRLDDLDVDLSLPDGGLPAGAVAVEPRVAPLPDCDPRVLRCDVVSAQQRSRRRVEPLLRVDLAVEVPGVFLAGVVDVSSAPACDFPGDRRWNLDRVPVLILDALAPPFRSVPFRSEGTSGNDQYSTDVAGTVIRAYLRLILTRFCR